MVAGFRSIVLQSHTTGYNHETVLTLSSYYHFPREGSSCIQSNGMPTPVASDYAQLHHYITFSMITATTVNHNSMASFLLFCVKRIFSELLGSFMRQQIVYALYVCTFIVYNQNLALISGGAVSRINVLWLCEYKT